jgi:dethiobiotin synthetase
VKELKIPVIIVAENKLGIINHALLTVEALKRRGIKVLGIFYNTWPGKKRRRDTNQEKIKNDNLKIVRKLGRSSTFKL